MTTGGYPPPQQDPRATGGHPGAPSYGATPPDYTQQFPQYGAPQNGGPQYGAPQYGTPQNGTPQFGAPQFGAPQYGAPPYGAPQDGGFGGPGFPGPDPNFGAGTRGNCSRVSRPHHRRLIVGIPMGILSAIMILASGGSGFVDFFMTVVSGVVAFGYWTYMESARGARSARSSSACRSPALPVVTPPSSRPPSATPSSRCRSSPASRCWLPRRSAVARRIHRYRGHHRAGRQQAGFPRQVRRRHPGT